MSEISGVLQSSFGRETDHLESFGIFLTSLVLNVTYVTLGVACFFPLKSISYCL